jgi:hypothetical protein
MALYSLLDIYVSVYGEYVFPLSRWKSLGINVSEERTASIFSSIKHGNTGVPMPDYTVP